MAQSEAYRQLPGDVLDGAGAVDVHRAQAGAGGLAGELIGEHLVALEEVGQGLVGSLVRSQNASAPQRLAKAAWRKPGVGNNHTA